MTPIECVCIHSFISDDEGDHYCDAVEETPTGWCVYLRTFNDEGGNFDIPDEWDFTNREAAIAWAEALSAKHGAPVHEY